MGNNKHSRMSPFALLCRISGEDYQIITGEGVEEELMFQFAFIGLLVLFIFILSFYSSTHFVHHLLNGGHAGAMAIGVVWGLMIVVIYELLLLTITPPILIGREHSHKGHEMAVTTEKKNLSRVSLAFRIAFVVLLAVVVTQPWLVTLFDTTEALDGYRRQYRNEFIVAMDTSIVTQETQLLSEMQMEESLHATPANESITSMKVKVQSDEVFRSTALQLEQTIGRNIRTKKGYVSDTLEDRLAAMIMKEEESDGQYADRYRGQIILGHTLVAAPDRRLAVLVEGRIAGHRRLNALLSSNNFYTKKVQLVNSQHPMAWGVTMLVVFIFVIPIALKYRIRNHTNFYRQKKELEEHFVRDEYAEFKLIYSKIFLSRFGMPVAYYESCEDAPFNTKRKKDTTTYPDQKALLEAVYPPGQESDDNKYLVSENIS